jgi:alginate O-acetyltransferase complex protein AlgI
MTYRNLIVTMWLGCLWHGASWNFLTWGGYHGGLLALERLFPGDRRPAEKWTWLYPAKAIHTFCLVLVGWVFFRAVDLTQGLRILTPEVPWRTWTK